MKTTEQLLISLTQFKKNYEDPNWTHHLPALKNNDYNSFAKTHSLLFGIIFTPHIYIEQYTRQTLSVIETHFGTTLGDPYLIFAEKCLAIAQHLANKKLVRTQNIIDSNLSVSVEEHQQISLAELAYTALNKTQQYFNTAEYEPLVIDLEDFIGPRYHLHNERRPSVVYFPLTQEYYAAASTEQKNYHTQGDNGKIRLFFLANEVGTILNQQKAVVVKAPLAEDAITMSYLKIERDYFKQAYPHLLAHYIQKNNFCRFVMSYIPGHTVDRYLTSLTHREKLLTFTRVGTELQLLHEKGIVHGDIKGPNIIATNKALYLIDFGSAYSINQPAVSYFNFADRKKIYHIAPERFCESENLNGSAAQDNYSFASLFLGNPLPFYHKKGYLLSVLQSALNFDANLRPPLADILTALKFEELLLLGRIHKNNYAEAQQLLHDILITPDISQNDHSLHGLYLDAMRIQENLSFAGLCRQKTNRQIHKQLIQLGLFSNNEDKKQSYRLACLSARAEYRRFATEQLENAPALRAC